MKIKFPRQFPKITQIPNSMKFRPVGTESSHAEQTDGLTKVTVAFRKFANQPKNKRTDELKAGRMWIRKRIRVFQVTARGVS